MPFHWSEAHQAAFEQKKYSLDPQSFIYLDLEADLFCTVIHPLVVLFGRFKMVNPDFWGMLVKVCQKLVRITV